MIDNSSPDSPHISPVPLIDNDSVRISLAPSYDRELLLRIPTVLVELKHHISREQLYGLYEQLSELLKPCGLSAIRRVVGDREGTSAIEIRAIRPAEVLDRLRGAEDIKGDINISRAEVLTAKGQLDEAARNVTPAENRESPSYTLASGYRE